MANKKNNKIEYEHRLTRLETSIITLSGNVTEIKNSLNNHITEIYNKIEEVNKKINSRPTWLITGVVTTLVALVIFLLTNK